MRFGTDRAQDGEKVIRPLFETRTVINGQSKQLSDDHDRQGIGQVLDDIHNRLGTCSIQQLIYSPLDVRSQALHPTGRKGMVHQAAQVGMIWRVGIKHRLGERVVYGTGDRSIGFRQTLEAAHQALSPGEPFIGVEGIDICVPRKHPEAHFIIPMDRIVLAEHVVERIWIGADLFTL